MQNGGRYSFDLKTVRDASLKAYKNATLGFKHDGSDLVIFDIDETCLSNAAFILAAKFEPQTAALPALEAIKTVYTVLYDLGFSVRRPARLHRCAGVQHPPQTACASLQLGCCPVSRHAAHRAAFPSRSKHGV